MSRFKHVDSLFIRPCECTHLANKVLDSDCAMFPVKPVPIEFPCKSYLLSCPFLSCPVLSCPDLTWPDLTCLSCPWLPWLIWDSHTETYHADVLLTDRGRCLLHCLSLCVPLPPAQPGFGSVNPLLFSPPLSLSRHQARLPSCSSTLSIAEVLLHGF